jgi:hypothetical protein
MWRGLAFAATVTVCAVTTPVIAAPGDAKAQQEANAYWASFLTKCGNSYFDRAGSGRDAQYTEYRGPAVFGIHAYPVTEIERANGVEWHGAITMNVPMARFTRTVPVLGNVVLRGGKWSDWSRMGEMEFELLKKQGQPWMVRKNIDDYYAPVSGVPISRPACSEIPA